jgi:mannose-P-dolichol utilization defect protein 1
MLSFAPTQRVAVQPAAAAAAPPPAAGSSRRGAAARRCPPSPRAACLPPPGPSSAPTHRRAAGARRRRAPPAAAAAAAAAGAAAAAPAAAAAAVAVGWLVIAGSCVRTAPQIVRVVRARSAEGLSLLSVTCELAAYAITSAFNLRFGYPFSTWGDTLLNGAQHAFLFALVLRLNRAAPPRAKAALVAALAAGGAALASGAIPDAGMRALQGGSVALLALGGRAPQIALNLRNGHSGELSVASTALSVAGNVARVFTSAALVGDPLVLGSAAAQLALNSILLWQALDTARRVRLGLLKPTAAAA